MTGAVDVTAQFGGSALPAVSFSDALHRLRTFVTHPHSGWSTYDLAAVHARESGAFDWVTPWSLLLADALAGQISIRNVSDFNFERRREFAKRVGAIPVAVDLADLDKDGVAAVVLAAQYGFPGVWAPKITKVASLYRPHAVPVLDGHVAAAFGHTRTRFSEGTEPRWEAIRVTIETMAEWLRDNKETITGLREQATDAAPDMEILSDSRILDIVLWTSQDDRTERSASPKDFWLTRDVGAPISLESVQAVRLIPPQ